MKKILTLIALLSVLVMFGQNPKDFAVKTTLAGEKSSFKAGETVSFKIESKCPEEFRMAAWVPYTYVGRVPENFIEALNIKINRKSKDPKWQGINFHKWVWLSKDKVKDIYSFETTDRWPEGDYEIIINVLFRRKDQPSGKTDVYRSSQIEFSIEK